MRFRRLSVAAMAAFCLALGVLPALSGAVPGSAALAAQAATNLCVPTQNVTMVSQDQLRTGWDACEPASLMGPSAVPKFVERWRTKVGGQVYAQPLVLGNTVFVATENDWVYGMNRTTGAILWQTHLGNAFVIGNATATKLQKCHDLIPNIGVTGTPAVDPASGDVYFYAKIMVGTVPQYFLVGIDPTNGSVVKKIQISGHPTNATKLTFDAQMQMQRTGVLISGGAAYAAFSAHCDTTPYAGYVSRVDLSTGKQSLWTDEAGTTDNRGGIWDSGGGMMTNPGDPSAGILTTSGNGVSPAAGPGSKPPGQLSESVISLKTSSTGTMSAQDFFSPKEAPTWDTADTDYGSGGPLGLPYGTATYPHVLVQAGKSGQIFVLNEDSLGGRDQGSGGSDASLFVTKAYGGQWGHPAIFEDGSTISAATNSTANNYLFYLGKQDALRVFRIEAGSGDQPVISETGNSSLTYPYTSGSPVVTSYRNDPATAVVWVVRTGGSGGTGGELDAYSLGSLINTSSSPSSCSSSAPCTLSPIWHSTSAFIATKFATPATSDGWVFVGTRNLTSKGTLAANGNVIGYSLPAGGTPLQPGGTVNSTSSTVAAAPVNATSISPVSITARKQTTITGVGTSGGASNAPLLRNAFRVGHVYLRKGGSGARQAVSFPVTLSPGDKLTAYVRFTPVAPGSNNGALTFRATLPRYSVHVPLTGDGIHNGITAQQTSVPFQLAPDQNDFTVPVHIPLQRLIDFTNYGTQPIKITSVTPPGGEFKAHALPRVGKTVNPGQTISVLGIFKPTHAGPATSSLTIAASSGPPATVTLTGTAVPARSQLRARRHIRFKTVRVGRKATASIRVTNTGNQTSLITGTSRLRSPFSATLTPPDRMPLNPTYDMTIPVTFKPTRKGSFTTRYTLHWVDATGHHRLTVTLTGKAV